MKSDVNAKKKKKKIPQGKIKAFYKEKKCVMSACIKIFVVSEVINCGISFCQCSLGSKDDKYYLKKYLLSAHWELIILLGTKDTESSQMWFLSSGNL